MNQRMNQMFTIRTLINKIKYQETGHPAGQSLKPPRSPGGVNRKGVQKCQHMIVKFNSENIFEKK